MDKNIRVLLVGDERIVTAAICALLERKEGMTVVGKANTANAAVRAKLLKPHVIVLALQGSDRPGIEVIEAIIKFDPHARILVLGAYANEKAVIAALKAGAVGYMLKTQPIIDLVQAIKHADQGRASLHPMVARILLGELNLSRERPTAKKVLGESELRVLLYVAQGLFYKEVAVKLGISCATVGAHMNSILYKLRLTNRTQAALYALKHGLATL